MATWFCGECGTEYSVGAPRCPHCLATDPIRPEAQLAKENEMAKITVAAGPSNVDAEPGQPGHVPAEGGESTEVEESAVETVDEGTEDDEAVDYGDFTVEDLRAELKERKLPTSGTKPELVARLVEADQPASASVQAGVAEGSGGASS